MIIAVAFICFILGFGAAVIVPRQSSRSRNNIVKLLGSLRLISPESKGVIAGNSNAEKLLSTVDTVSSKPIEKGLLTKREVESIFEPSSWQSLAYQDFKAAILAKETGMKVFPCIYATMGYRSNEHRYVFLESDNPAEPRNIRLIAPALREYLSMARSLGSNTSLVIVAAPSEREVSVEEYNQSFWEMLRGLRIIDKRPWPKEVPEVVDSEKWTFCFDGEPVFPVMLTPAHSQRWSRHMSVPIIALQPKWVLDQLLSTPEKREVATGKVRRLLKEFDQIDVSPDLTSYGEAGTSESRQLCLLDKNETAGCPYNNLDG